MSLRRPLVTLIALAALGLASTVAGCNPLSGSGPGGGNSVVNVAIVPGIENASFALAEHKGMFASAGVDVRVRRYASDEAALNALSSGSVQVASVDYGDLFFSEASPASAIYKIIADGYDAGTGVAEIMTLSNSSISSPTQLAGQTIAFPDVNRVSSNNGAPTSLLQAAATSVLQNYGVNLTTVTWQHMSPMAEITALLHKKVQAILLTEPYIYLADQAGATELADAFSGSTAGIPLSGYVTTKAWYREHPSSATAFRTAIEQAAALASMPGPIQQVLPQWAHLTKQQTALVTVGTYPTATISANLQRAADLMAVQGMIRFGLNVAAMIIRLAVTGLRALARGYFPPSPSWRAMIKRCTSDVPSPISSTLASR